MTNFNHINLAEQALPGSLSTAIIANGAVTVAKLTIDANVDFNEFQALDFRIQNLTSFPPVGNVGRLIWRTDLNDLYVDTGASWTPVSVGGAVSSIHADANPLLVGAVQLVSGTGITLSQVGQAITINNTSTITTGNLTDTGTDGIVIIGGTGAVVGSGTSIAQHVSDTTHNGYLNSTDWNTFNNKQSAGNYITALTGDVTATGPGSVASTVVSVGGSSATNVHSAELAANAATNLNTISTIVKRDGSGNFSAGTITASLTGHSSLDLSLSGGTMSGNIDMSQHQLVNAVIQTGTSEPVSPVEGQIFYRTDTHQAELWNGTSWVLLG